MNTENSKRREPHKFVLNLLQILGLKSSNKHVAIKTCLFITPEKIYDNNGMISLNCLIVLIQRQAFKIILSTS